MTGGEVSADTFVVVASQMEVADKHTVRVEHLQQQQSSEVKRACCHPMHGVCHDACICVQQQAL